MTLEEFITYMNTGKEVEVNSKVHNYMHTLSQVALKLTMILNQQYHDAKDILKIMSDITNTKIDDSFSMFPPFYTDCGKNLKIGKNVFINAGCKIQDQGGVILEEGVLLGHNVVIATLNHSLNPKKRGNLIPGKVHIKKNVWVGANVVICPGVTIEEGAVIAAGAVVNKNVSKNSVVGGVPAKFIKSC